MRGTVHYVAAPRARCEVRHGCHAHGARQGRNNGGPKGHRTAAAYERGDGDRAGEVGDAPDAGARRPLGEQQAARAIRGERLHAKEGGACAHLRVGGARYARARHRPHNATGGVHGAHAVALQVAAVCEVQHRRPADGISARQRAAPRRVEAGARARAVHARGGAAACQRYQLCGGKAAPRHIAHAVVVHVAHPH